MPARTHYEVKPHTIDEILDETFRQYRDGFTFWFRTAVIVFLPYLLINAIFTYRTTAIVHRLLSTLTQSDRPTPLILSAALHNSTRTLGLLLLLIIVDVVVVRPVLFASIVHFVSEKQLHGRRVSAAHAIRHAFRRLGPILVTIVLRYVLVILGFVIAAVIIAIAIAVLLAVQVPNWIPALIGGLLAVVVLIVTLWTCVRTAMALPVVVQEQRTFWSPIARSWVLTRHNFWRILSVFIVLVLISPAIQAAIPKLFDTWFHAYPIVSIMVTDGVTLLLTPLTLFGAANLYVDLCVRHSGYREA